MQCIFWNFECAIPHFNHIFLVRYVVYSTNALLLLFEPLILGKISHHTNFHLSKFFILHTRKLSRCTQQGGSVLPSVDIVTSCTVKKVKILITGSNQSKKYDKWIGHNVPSSTHGPSIPKHLLQKYLMLNPILKSVFTCELVWKHFMLIHLRFTEQKSHAAMI